MTRILLQNQVKALKTTFQSIQPIQLTKIRQLLHQLLYPMRVVMGTALILRQALYPLKKSMQQMRHNS